MISLVLKFFLSILVFNWMCAELEIVAPELMNLGQKVTEAASIPTHDKWNVSMGSAGDVGEWFSVAERQTRQAYDRHASALPSLNKAGSNRGNVVSSLKRMLQSSSSGRSIPVKWSKSSQLIEF